MRRRLLALVFGTTLLALTLLGVIFLSVIWSITASASVDRAAATARVTAAALEDTLEAGGVITADTLSRYVRDEAFLTATLEDGTQLTAGEPFQGRAYSAEATVDKVTVVAAIPVAINVRRILAEGLVVVAVSLVALGLAMIAASYYARRLTRPLEDFGDLAARMAVGDRRQIDQRYGVPELDAVAEVLDRGVTSFNALLENERRITTEASHQLRTPLTALSLRLEEILATDDLQVARHEAQAALGQVERLSGVVDEVLGVRRGIPLGLAEEYSLDELVQTQLTEWAPAYAAVGRSLTRGGLTGLSAFGLRGAQAQALATLVENALVHGSGRTTVRTRRAGDWAVIEVSDGGGGIAVGLEDRVFDPSVSGASSSGLGLGLARTLVSADGGRLELISARPAVFGMFLPTSTREPDEVHRDEVQTDEVQTDEVQTDEAMAASSAAAGSSGKTQRR